MPCQPKDPLRPFTVSVRDRAIYQAVRIEQRAQKVVALEHHLTQQRVSAIVQRVERWLAQSLPTGFQEIERGSRLRLASRAHQMRLDFLHREAVEAWQNSKQVKRTIKEKTVKGETVREMIVQTRDGDWRHWQDALTSAERIAEFEGFDRQGNVDVSGKGRVVEAVERTPVEIYRKIKRLALIGELDTPGDEGIPGAWAEEMQARNIALPFVARDIRESDAPAKPNAGRDVVGRGVATGGGSPGASPSRGMTAVAEHREGQGGEDASFRGAKGDNEGDCVSDPEEVLCEKHGNASEVVEQQDVSTNKNSDQLLLKPPAQVPKRLQLPDHIFTDYPNYEELAKQVLYFDENGYPRDETTEEMSIRLLGYVIKPNVGWTYGEFPPRRPLYSSKERQW